MNHQTRDLGEIIRNHVYVREVYPTSNNEKCLYTSIGFLKKLAKIYTHLGIHLGVFHEMDIKVKLPDNPNPAYRNHWRETTIRKSRDKTTVKALDKFFRYYNKEVVFASSAWMGEYESFPGDEIVIMPLINFSKLKFYK